MTFNTRILDMQSAIVQATQEIIQHKSVEGPAEGDMPFGRDVHKCFIHTLDLANSLGIKTKNVDNYAGHAEIGQGDDIVGILVHLDVVPEGDNWDFDPYGGEISDGKIYGRGTLDDKGPAIASLFAMKAIQDSGVALKKRVRLIFGLNEETHWQGINYYLKHEDHPSIGFTPDSSFPACHGEKGILMIEGSKKLTDTEGLKIIQLTGGKAANMVPDEASASLNQILDLSHIKCQHPDRLHISHQDNMTLIKTTGVSAHGSTPEVGLNAISILMEVLSQINLDHEDQRDFISFYQDTIGYDLHGQRAHCAFEDEDSGKLSYNVGVLSMTCDQVKMVTNVRYPITTAYDQVIDGMKAHYQKIAMTFKEDDHMKPIYFPKDHALIEKLMKVYQDHTGDMAEPSTTGGGTYARALDNVVAFGGVFPGDPELAHQKNEHIEISKLIKTAQIYASAIYELAKE